MRTLVMVAIAVAGVALFEGIFYALRFWSERRDEELRRRLQSLDGGDGGSQFTLLRPGHLARSPSLDAILRAFSASERLERLIEQADVQVTVARLLAYMAVAALAGLSLGLLSRAGIGVGLILAAIGAALPILYVIYARDRRSAKLSEQLPDALDMMGRSLRAGHALANTFKLIASEMPSPINVEFGRAFEEQNLGIPFDRAVVQMTIRAPTNRDLKIFAVSVIVQKETGGNLVEIIEKIADTIRARYHFYGKLRALTAEGRVSGYILGALPILTGLVITFTTPEYMSKLWTDRYGTYFLIYAILSWLAGFIIMRRMARVDL